MTLQSTVMWRMFSDIQLLSFQGISWNCPFHRPPPRVQFNIKKQEWRNKRAHRKLAQTLSLEVVQKIVWRTVIACSSFQPRAQHLACELPWLPRWEKDYVRPFTAIMGLGKECETQPLWTAIPTLYNNLQMERIWRWVGLRGLIAGWMGILKGIT